jgi:hypothetical protein
MSAAQEARLLSEPKIFEVRTPGTEDVTHALGKVIRSQHNQGLLSYASRRAYTDTDQYFSKKKNWSTES